MIGMSTRRSDWKKSLQQTGGVDARRLFGNLGSPSILKEARAEHEAGRYAILSYKVPGNDWAGVARGKYDRQLEQLADDLASPRQEA